MFTRNRCVLVALIAALVVTAAQGWHSQGHHKMARLGVAALPATVPAFFREGTHVIASCAIDPDLARDRSTPQYSDAESADHYFDLELLGGAELPATRHQFLALLEARKLDPKAVGYLPYALIESTQRLKLAFAEHRKWPDDPAIQAKCLVYAGHIAHYAADLCQPLHCTIHHDGRARADHTSPRTGIHQQVDALFTRLKLDDQRALAAAEPKRFAELWPAVRAQLAASHALVDRVYELESKLPKEPTATPAAEVEAFAQERLATSAQFIASLYLTAWEDSANVTLPAWLDRAAPEEAK